MFAPEVYNNTGSFAFVTIFVTSRCAMQWFTSMKGSFNSSTNSFPALRQGPNPGPAE